MFKLNYIKIAARSSAVLLLLCAVLLPSFCVGVSADVFENNMPKAPSLENVGAAYVYNVENDRVLLSHNPDGLIYPSSLTKVMSFLVCSEILAGRLEESVTLTEEMIAGSVGNRAGLAAGEVFTIKQLMYIAFCGCNNDAVNALAYIASGSVKDFVTAMNEKALALGAQGTVFRNPTGIHNDAMVTTMSDLALICREAAKSELILRVTGAERYEIPQTDTTPRYMVYNRNMLMSARSSAAYVNKNATGLNAGMTDQGGECLATVASKDGLTYIIVITGGVTLTDEEGRHTITSYKLANELIDWSFNNFGYVHLFDATVPCADINVIYSNGASKISVLPTEEIVMYLPLTFNPFSRLTFKTKFDKVEFEAPIEKGTVVGSMAILYRDELIGEVGLVTTEDASRDDFLYSLSRIKEFSQNRVFLLTVAFAILYAILFTIIGAVIRHIARKRELDNL